MVSFVPRRKRKRRRRPRINGQQLLVLLGVLLTGVLPVHAQRWAEMAWKPFFTSKGVEFSYIFYPEADGRYDGVVIRLVNHNPYPVAYRFTVVFRSDSAETSRQVSGRIPAGAMVTGDTHGLFWIPFTDGRRLHEIGLRGWSIERLTPF